MAYNGGDADTKQSACTDCLDLMRSKGVFLFTQKEVENALAKLTFGKALKLLHEIGYEPCYYPNDLDEYLIKRKLITTKAKDGKWGKRLRNLNIL